MAKRSNRRPPRQNKDHAGCMWGLMNMFDFRHGRTTKRLLSDRRYVTKNTIGTAHPTSEVNLHTNFNKAHPNVKDGNKSEKPTFDLVKTRVKELIEEEMCIDQPPQKQNDTNTRESLNLTNHKHTVKTSKRSFDHEISISRQVSAPETSPYHDLEALMQEILLVHRKRNEQHGDLDTRAKRSFPITEEKLIESINVLMNEKSTDGKDMFQMLSSNKEMLLKLLHDQDQHLFSLNEDQKSKSTNQQPEEPVIRKHRKFFRRRSKSHESIPLNGKDRIVILKPRSLDNQTQTGNEINIERNASQFSFMEIKRRLKHAMGKEGPSEKTGKTVLDSGWSSPNRDHFYTERFARVSKLRESELKTGDTNHRISNIYVEAKKHLSEMLTSGDKDAESMMRSLPKSLGRLLSFRDYNSFSPGTSPRAQMRPLAREDSRSVNESQPSATNDDPEEKVPVSDDTSCQRFQEMVKSPSCDKVHEEHTKVSDLSCELHASPNYIVDVHDEVILDGVFSECLKPDLTEEKDSSPTTSGPLLSSKTEELEITKNDTIGKPSPISVLEPLFSDDDISPARTVSRPVETAVQPLCIQFDKTVSATEDQQIQIRNSTDSEESPFEYVEAVLLSSDLNWLEFEKRWLSSAPILDPSLFDEVETFSSRAKYDQRLLFDSTNEALKEVCDRFVLESSFIKRLVWPVPKGMDLINEVWGRLESRLYMVYPRDLDKLVKYDLEVSRMWLDVRSELRDLVIKIEESIFEEMIDDTLLSLLNDCVVGEVLHDEINNAMYCS